MKAMKRPVTVEVFQMTVVRRWDNSEWPEWLHRAWNEEQGHVGSLYCVDEDGMVGPGERLFIGTLEGQQLVSWDDWIIQGVMDEIYPCKPEIFDLTYNIVEQL